MAVERDDVIWCYRIILGREPESEETVRLQINNHANRLSLRDAFFLSEEFAAQRLSLPSSKSKAGFLPLDLPKNEVEYQATPSQLAQCIAEIKTTWSHLGATTPHFSVLTDPQFLPGNLGKNLDAFWASGKAEADKVARMLVRHGVTSLSRKTCVEYGCGVGRVTFGLAQLFSHVHGYDVSEGHLSRAEQRAQELGVANCRFHLCSGAPLEPLPTCDFFYSRIVFQHNPPPIISQLVRNALRALKPDAIAIFQVPTYRIGYRHSINDWLATDHAPDMQMHCLPQKVIFEIVADENCVLLEVREDDSTGAPDQFISNTFVVRRLDASGTAVHPEDRSAEPPPPRRRFL